MPFPNNKITKGRSDTIVGTKIVALLVGGQAPRVALWFLSVLKKNGGGVMVGPHQKADSDATECGGVMRLRPK